MRLLFLCLLLGGAAWHTPSLGGGVFLPLFLGCGCFSLSFCVLLPSFSSFGWRCFLSLFCWVVLLCLLLLWVFWVGGTAFPLSSVGWCCLAYFFFGWCCFFPCAASSPLFGRAALSFSSVTWCCLASFFGWCCVFPSPIACCCLPSPPLGGAVFLLFCWVVLLGFLQCWAVGWFGVACWVVCWVVGLCVGSGVWWLGWVLGGLGGWVSVWVLLG